jgi:sulfatase maturation enzyme AslB (radical SAM superfamily)
MANVLITNRCNRKCSFCFAKNKIGHSENNSSSENMTLENVRKVMDFLKRSDNYDLRLMGGEPTLHPDFIEIVSEALSENFHVHIFTNGIMSKKIADFIASVPDDKISILCNISPQDCDTDKMVSLRNYALEQLGQKISLGITVTSPVIEYQFLIDLIKRYNLIKRVRVGIAQPVIGESNDYLDPCQYSEVGAAITKVAVECVKEDILIGFDCGLTLCMFTEMEIGILAKCSEGFSSICCPIIDIGPTLDIWSCFPLSAVLNSKLENFQTRSEITDLYKKVTHPYKILGCKPECMTCDFLRRGQCAGGCLAHSITSLNRTPPKYISDDDN